MGRHAMGQVLADLAHRVDRDLLFPLQDAPVAQLARDFGDFEIPHIQDTIVPAMSFSDLQLVGMPLQQDLPLFLDPREDRRQMGAPQPVLQPSPIVPPQQIQRAGEGLAAEGAALSLSQGLARPLAPTLQPTDRIQRIRLGHPHEGPHKVQPPSQKLDRDSVDQAPQRLRPIGLGMDVGPKPGIRPRHPPVPVEHPKRLRRRFFGQNQQAEPRGFLLPGNRIVAGELRPGRRRLGAGGGKIDDSEVLRQ